MDYLNFCKSYFSATSIPVNLLDNVNILYSSVRTVTNIPQYNDYYVPDDLPNFPCFSHYDPSIEYGIVRVQDTSIHIVIGPVFETEITPEILNAYLRENKIPFSERDKIQDFLCSIPRMNQLQLAKHLIFLHQAINNETCELSHFFPDYTPSADDMATNTRSNIGDEAKEYFNTYSNELRLYEIIKMGNEEELESYLNQIPLSILAKPMATSALRQAKSCMPFIRAVMEADFAQVEQYKNELVGYMQDLPLEQGQSLALLYLYNLYYEMGFYDMQVAYKLGLDHRLYQRLRAIETQRDLVIYFTSVLRRIMEYFESNYDQQFPDPVRRAKRFLDDSYMRADLTLGEVAQSSGYNEKYFCTLFKKRFDVSYSDYLTGLRIAAARELLEKTNMRMYEVCDAVGYNSVEHFLRTFKRATGQTPLQYRKQIIFCIL